MHNVQHKNNRQRHSAAYKQQELCSTVPTSDHFSQRICCQLVFCCFAATHHCSASITCYINKLNIFGCFRQRNNVEFTANPYKKKSVERNWANDCNKFDWRKFASFIRIHISSLLLFEIIIKFLCCSRDFTPMPIECCFGMILQSRNTESQRMDESICIEHITTDHTVHVYGIIKSIK